MPKSTVEKYLEGLANDSYMYTHARTRRAMTVGTHWVERLGRARESTVEAVAVALLDGSPLAPSAMPGVINRYTVQRVVREKITDPVAVLTDPATSLQVLLMVGWSNRHRSERNRYWRLFLRVVRDRLKLGLIEDPEVLRWFIDYIIDEDRKFGIDLLAHTTFAMSLDEDAEFDARGMNPWREFEEYRPMVLQRRQKLAAKRWLRAHISAEEYVQARELTPDLRRSLYPDVAGGYQGYRAALGFTQA